MKILYQQVVPDPAKARAIVKHVESDLPEGATLLGVAMGDPSCPERMLALWERWRVHPEAEALREDLARTNATLFLQLPLVVKQAELAGLQSFLLREGDAFGGYITGDLGLAAWIGQHLAGRPAATRLILTTNVVNGATGRLLMERLCLYRLRPLMHRRTFIEEPVGVPKDVVVFGNMLLNASTFCLYHDDSPPCAGLPCMTAPGQDPRDLLADLVPPPAHLSLAGERVLLAGRSLYTDRRLDLIPSIARIPDLASVTVQDANLSLEEITRALDSITRHVRPA